MFGGWGLYYDRIATDYAIDEKLKITHPDFNVFFAPRGQAPKGNEVAWNDAYLTSDKATLDALVHSSGSPELWLIDNQFKLPKSTQWSLGMRQVFGSGFSASVTYANQHATDLITFGRADSKLNPDGFTCCQFTGSHGFSGIVYSTNDGETWYHSLQFQADRAYSRPSPDAFGWGAGLSFTAAKRELKGLDNVGDNFSFPFPNAIPKHASNDENTALSQTGSRIFRVFGHPVVGPRNARWKEQDRCRLRPILRIERLHRKTLSLVDSPCLARSRTRTST